MGWASAQASPISFTDDRGQRITISQQPASVVSLVPSVTEVILKIGAGDALAGITHHSVFPKEASQKRIVGGFFSPSLKAIQALSPDVIFYSGLQKEVIKAFEGSGTLLICLRTTSPCRQLRRHPAAGPYFRP